MCHEARPSRQCGHPPATRPAAEYDGVEYAGLPVKAVVLPPPFVAELLGYSHQVTQRHAELAAQPWSRYIT